MHQFVIERLSRDLQFKKVKYYFAYFVLSGINRYFIFIFKIEIAIKIMFEIDKILFHSFNFKEFNSKSMN